MTMIRHRLLTLLMLLCGLQAGLLADDAPVTLKFTKGATTMSNGLLTVEIAKDGSVSAITTADGQKVINPGATATTYERGYLSYVVIEDGVRRTGELKSAKPVRPIVESDDMAEVVYHNEDRDLKWYVGYVMRRGVSGLYTYVSLQNTSATPAGIEEARLVWRVNPSLFNYCWVSDDAQGALPTPAQMKNYVAELQDATYLLDDGSVYTKYDWAAFMRDDLLHGLMGSNVGVWSITPATDWINGGPDKQDLTLHATDSSPLILQMFQSQHFGASATYFDKGGQKLFGPYLLYVNSGDSQQEMVDDAKRQAAAEAFSWPYEWFDNDLYPLSRATVSGTVSIDAPHYTTDRLRVVLSEPGGNPMAHGSAYQYWAETDGSGHFTIAGVRPGSYTLYAYALNGEATGWLEKDGYTITPGDNDLGEIVWQPRQYDGGLLWSIGSADHATAGFRLSDHARQYGLWESVPASLTYTIGQSDPATDWYYAQAQEGTWTINFNCDKTYADPLHLTIATAGAARSNIKVEVKFNDNEPLQSIAYQNDACVYRSATLGGKDSLVVVEVPAGQLQQGTNALHLKLWNKGTGVGGVMYDCIKLESGKLIEPSSTAIRSLPQQDTEADVPVYDLFGRRQPASVLPRGIYVKRGQKFVVR